MVEFLVILAHITALIAGSIASFVTYFASRHVNVPFVFSLIFNAYSVLAIATAIASPRSFDGNMYMVGLIVTASVIMIRQCRFVYSPWFQ